MTHAQIEKVREYGKGRETEKEGMRMTYHVGKLTGKGTLSAAVSAAVAPSMGRGEVEGKREPAGGAQKEYSGGAFESVDSDEPSDNLCGG
uniref:Uncharacterized protein n=1 Tax=Pristionchus pacificus TaxID=54126 RepID=A0A2A6BR11_PRIPA|eukprot:PDM68266.1 hypothetical protein PRIPAC_46310 [Pristionchus pacificus]